MANQPVLIGSAPNDGNGDTIKQAFIKMNANFAEIYGGQWNPPTFYASRFVVTNAGQNTVAGTTYTLQSSDNGKAILCTSNSAVTITVPVGLPTGFSCTIMQLGTGAVTITPSVAVVHNAEGLSKTAGQYCTAALFSHAADTFILTGNLTT